MVNNLYCDIPAANISRQRHGRAPEGINGGPRQSGLRLRSQSTTRTFNLGKHFPTQNQNTNARDGEMEEMRRSEKVRRDQGIEKERMRAYCHSSEVWSLNKPGFSPIRFLPGDLMQRSLFKETNMVWISSCLPENLLLYFLNSAKVHWVFFCLVHMFSAQHSGNCEKLSFVRKRTNEKWKNGVFCWIGPGSATIGGYAIFISLLLFSCHSHAVIGFLFNLRKNRTNLKLLH